MSMLPSSATARSRWKDRPERDEHYRTQSPPRHLSARGERLLRRGRVRAGQGARLPHGRARGGEPASARAWRSGMLKHLEAYLACCQLGITMASLGLGWVGEPTVAALLEPLLRRSGCREAALHFDGVPGRIPGLLLAAHRPRRTGAEDVCDPANRSRYRYGSPIRSTPSFFSSIRSTGCSTPRRAPSFRCSASGRRRTIDILTDVEIEGLVGSLGRARQDGGEPGRVHPQPLPLRRARGVGHHGPPHQHACRQYRRAGRADHRRYSRQPLYTRARSTRASQRTSSALSMPRISSVRFVGSAATWRRSTCRSIATKPWFVPDSTSLTDQLNAFLKRKTHFALVVDEYGEVQGLVTLEDILEEIVGEIADEHDIDIQGVRPQPDGSVNADGSVPIRDLNRVMGWHLPDDEATTVAGLVIHEARIIPEAARPSPSTVSASRCCERAATASRLSASPRSANASRRIEPANFGRNQRLTCPRPESETRARHAFRSHHRRCELRRVRGGPHRRLARAFRRRHRGQARAGGTRPHHAESWCARRSTRLTSRII